MTFRDRITTGVQLGQGAAAIPDEVAALLAARNGQKDVRELLKDEALRLLLPERLRGHRAAPDFLLDVVDACVEVSESLLSHDGHRPERTRDELLDVCSAASATLSALQALSDGSDAFEVLAGHAEHLRQRTEPPMLPAELPELPVLLTRIRDDLRVLRQATKHAADRCALDRNAPKGAERVLVRMIVASFAMHFEEPPPQRGWFADDLCKYLGDALGIVVGWRAVGEVVRGLR
jgi:hypothetical protein